MLYNEDFESSSYRNKSEKKRTPKDDNSSSFIMYTHI